MLKRQKLDSGLALLLAWFVQFETLMMHKVDGALDKYFFIFNLRLFFSYLLAENNF